MRCVYNCIPATNRVSTVCSVAAVLYLQFVLHVMLFCMLNVLYLCIITSRSMCAVPSMAVFCSFLISCFPVMLLGYCLSDFQTVPVAPIITAISFASTIHMH
jgi:hypothetical protein